MTFLLVIVANATETIRNYLRAKIVSIHMVFRNFGQPPPHRDLTVSEQKLSSTKMSHTETSLIEGVWDLYHLTWQSGREKAFLKVYSGSFWASTEQPKAQKSRWSCMANVWSQKKLSLLRSLSILGWGILHDFLHWWTVRDTFSNVIQYTYTWYCRKFIPNSWGGLLSQPSAGSQRPGSSGTGSGSMLEAQHWGPKKGWSLNFCFCEKWSHRPLFFSKGRCSCTPEKVGGKFYINALGSSKFHHSPNKHNCSMFKRCWEQRHCW